MLNNTTGFMTPQRSVLGEGSLAGDGLEFESLERFVVKSCSFQNFFLIFMIPLK